MTNQTVTDQNFTGPCRGGPDDGKETTHYMDEFVVTARKLIWPSPNSFPKYVPTLLGTYRFVDGAWVWQGANDA